MAKDVRWLQLQVESSGVAPTRKQPAELQPPPPPQEEGKNMNARRHFGSGFNPFCVLTIQRPIPECAGGRLVGLKKTKKNNKNSSPGGTETTHLSRVGVPDRELDVLRQVAY